MKMSPQIRVLIGALCLVTLAAIVLAWRHVALQPYDTAGQSVISHFFTHLMKPHF